MKSFKKHFNEAKDTHCSDECCGADVKAEDCDCSADCPHCNCNSVKEAVEPDLDEALLGEERESYYSSKKHAYKPKRKEYDPHKVATQAHLQHAHDFHDVETDKGYDRYQTSRQTVPHHKAQVGHLHKAMKANATGDKAALKKHMHDYHHGNENHKINKSGTYPHAHHLPHHGSSNVNETFDPKHPKVMAARKAVKSGTYNGNVDRNGNAIVHIDGKPHTVTKGDPAAKNEALDEISMDTLSSYKDKAKYSRDKAQNSADANYMRGTKGSGGKNDPDIKTMQKRDRGKELYYSNITNKLRKQLADKKEDVQLDELSPATLKSYKKKSLKQYKQSANKRMAGGGDYGSATKAAQDKHQKRFDKRHKGIGSEIKRTTDDDIHLKDPKGLVRKNPKANSMTGKPAPYKNRAESLDVDTYESMNEAIIDIINENNITIEELENMTEEELQELLRTTGKVIGGTAKAAYGLSRLAGRGIKAVGKAAVMNKQGNVRGTQAAKTDAAKAKNDKLQSTLDSIRDKRRDNVKQKLAIRTSNRLKRQIDRSKAKLKQTQNKPKPSN